MLSGIGGTTPYDSGSPKGKTAAPRNSDSVAALNGEIRNDQIQLNDWTTCVSAKTTKGQAEIQKYSAQVSAAKERIALTETQNSPSQTAAVQASSSHDSLSATSDRSTRDQRSGVLLDTWA